MHSHLDPEQADQIRAGLQRDPATGPAGVTPGEDHDDLHTDHRPDREPDEPFVERRSPRPPRNFPGGAARLPRLNRSNGEIPEFLPPLRQNPEERAPEKDRGFEAYYSTDSLFSSAPEPEDQSAVEGPYAVLGLTRSASWEAVSKAHRRLVAQLHPDRYVREEPPIREAAERRVRDVNEAFAAIRRERAVHR